MDDKASIYIKYSIEWIILQYVTDNDLLIYLWKPSQFSIEFIYNNHKWYICIIMWSLFILPHNSNLTSDAYIWTGICYIYSIHIYSYIHLFVRSEANDFFAGWPSQKEWGGRSSNLSEKGRNNPTTPVRIPIYVQCSSMWIYLWIIYLPLNKDKSLSRWKKIKSVFLSSLTYIDG